ncbi:response regulator [Caulobacter sp. 17J65-9]|uniref:response regulator n=1 Tax=Caulobacter sp. 17J65-9 TaxID=2709382 RepID=UPI0013CAFB07|nr:response regulator [Caulobacter sp. 17J65-9]NEX91865.1 response regulator [Caulobacter sp. 17J65-9]
MHLLVVEDQGVFAEAMAEELKAAGHEVDGPARSMEEGLKLARKRKPELALVDIGLKVEGDGIMLARMLWLEFEVPSLFVSGSREEAVANADLAVGLVEKPVAPEKVVRAVEAARAVLHGDPAPAGPSELTLFSHRPRPPSDAPGLH